MYPTDPGLKKIKLESIEDVSVTAKLKIAESTKQQQNKRKCVKFKEKDHEANKDHINDLASGDFDSLPSEAWMMILDNLQPKDLMKLFNTSEGFRKLVSTKNNLRKIKEYFSSLESALSVEDIEAVMKMIQVGLLRKDLIRRKAERIKKALESSFWTDKLKLPILTTAASMGRMGNITSVGSLWLQNINISSTYDISLCLYQSGELHKFVDPKVQNLDDLGTPAFDEFGKRFKYKCTVEGCDKGAVKAKLMGYKELAIHMAWKHGVLERCAEQSQVKGAQELHQILRMRREDEGQSLQDIPEISVEELHTCLLCDGEDKEGFSLSLQKDKLYGTRYHYANCLTNQEEKLRQLVQMYPPERHNLTQEGLPQDMVGKVFKYNCTVSGCTRTHRRKLGYKEFVIHMCCDHGGLEDILAAHEEEKVRKMIPKLKFQNNK